MWDLGEQLAPHPIQDAAPATPPEMAHENEAGIQVGTSREAPKERSPVVLVTGPRREGTDLAKANILSCPMNSQCP
ncbi:hypothetical protein GCM10010840_20840 [Deinococcus aerolatus]|uniref:Uncharacterized protein n=1 Tax=Deinococcus aerolatus TaxID=522487 RepID=A0ABQ2GAK8_9DEIO|nr:hypothetical protein GCM10010840_20840 [Deinococcus aerolatus]